VGGTTKRGWHFLSCHIIFGNFAKIAILDALFILLGTRPMGHLTSHAGCKAWLVK
jgi:hypothetical protein